MQNELHSLCTAVGGLQALVAAATTQDRLAAAAVKVRVRVKEFEALVELGGPSWAQTEQIILAAQVASRRREFCHFADGPSTSLF